MKIKVFVLFFCFHFVNAQLATKTWKSHFNYTNATHVEIVGDLVYCSTSNGFFLYNTKSDTFLKIDKSYLKYGGIISCFKYLKTGNTLLIAYQDGGIEFLNLNDTYYPRDSNYLDFLKDLNQESTYKRVFDIIVHKNNSYLATSFGLLIFDNLSQTLIESVQDIGENGSRVAVTKLKVSNDSLFALCDNNQIKAISLLPKYNIQFYGNWNTLLNSTIFDVDSNKYFDNTKFQINDFEIAENGTVWAADKNMGLLKKSNVNIEVLIPNGLPKPTGEIFSQNYKVYFNSIDTYEYQGQKWHKNQETLVINKQSIDSFSNIWELIGNRIVVKNGPLSLSFGVSNGLPGTPLCFSIDLKNQVWIGTTNGIAVIQSSSNIVTRPSSFYFPIFNNQRLFVQESVNEILTDPGNRKWIGTSRGLFHLSENGDELIDFFDSENSPFFTNLIEGLVLNSVNGELFVQTSSAIYSYQTDSKFAQESFDQVLVYPNPIRSNFKGVLTIDNLENDTVIEIAEIGGTVVFETVSNGGRAVWDLKIKNGLLAQNGVYLVKLSNSNKTKVKIEKFAILR
jgi:hypothetical protein